MKFDLGPLEGKDIESATLQLFARRVDLAGGARLVDVHLVQGDWSEESLTFGNAPQWEPSPTASTAVDRADTWYSWDVTSGVVGQKGTEEASFAVLLRDISEGREEQAVFVSREGAAHTPRLVVTFTEDRSTLERFWWAILTGAVAVAAALSCTGGGLLRRRRA